MTEDEQRRQVWLAVIERIQHLSIALHATLDAVSEFPATGDDSLAVDRALSRLDAAVALFQDSKLPRLVASGWLAAQARHW